MLILFMRDRFMRTIVFFDLPVLYSADRKNYRKFKKYLIMLQNSVYSKLCLNSQQADLLIQRIKKNSPKKGIIQVLKLTENQYSQIEYIIGNSNTKVESSEDSLIVL